MKYILLTTAATLGFASTAMAGNPGPAPTPAPFEIAAPAVTWDGLYVGGLVSFDSGDWNRFVGGALDNSDPLIAVTNFGGFAGYNKQVNSMVFGGEVAFTSGDITLESFATSNFPNRLDLKAKVGYSFGRAMVYGVVGYSWSDFDDAGNPFPHSGLNYGVGVDVMISSHIFVGAEYLMRDLAHTSVGFTNETNIDSAAIRIGYKF